jgi:predicted transport protein
MKFTKLKTISLKSAPQLNEKWIQEVIAADPTILGLGELRLIQKEKIQPTGGRLDLLLQEDKTGGTRYEVELQLGSTDETHVIRTIEYWDIERKRYPQYDHVAVLIAENVTARFLNVISLFNGFIPLIVMQVTAFDTPDGVALHFTKVIDRQTLGLSEEDESEEPVSRSFWESKATLKTVELADQVLTLCQTFDDSLELKYNKNYIGFQTDGRAFNFAYCKPRKSALNLSVYVERTADVDDLLEASGLDLLEYGKWGVYQIKVSNDDLKKHASLLTSLLKMAYEKRK